MLSVAGLESLVQYLASHQNDAKVVLFLLYSRFLVLSLFCQHCRAYVLEGPQSLIM